MQLSLMAILLHLVTCPLECKLSYHLLLFGLTFPSLPGIHGPDMPYLLIKLNVCSASKETDCPSFQHKLTRMRTGWAANIKPLKSNRPLDQSLSFCQYNV